MTARGGVVMLLMVLTGCATGTPVGLRIAAGDIRHRRVVPRDSPDVKVPAPAQRQAPLSRSGGGGNPAALVARTAMGVLPRVDAFEELLLLAGLDERDALPVQGSPLTPEVATRLLALLLRKPVTLGNFPPRMAAGHLLREVLEGGAVSREELLRRVERFSGVAVLRPDGYLAWVRTGRTQQKVGPVEWKDGVFRAHGCELGRFYNGRKGAFRLADARMQIADDFPLANVHDDADLISRSLDGAQEAFFELALAIGQMLTSPTDSLAALQHLPAGVAALIASSPAYLERFRYMTRGEQIQAVAKLTTSLLATWGAAGGATRTLTGALGSAEAVVPVLSLSADGMLVLERVAVPVGRAAAVLSGGPGAALILHRANTSTDRPSPAGGPGQWGPAKESLKPPARRYQEQITGHSADEAYWVGGTSTLAGGVKFDGFQNGVLLEAKGPGYAKFFDGLNPKTWFRNTGAQKLIEQADRQIRMVRGMGIPIEWHVAEKQAADAIRRLLREAKFEGIEVVHTSAR